MGNPTRRIDPTSRDWTLVNGQRAEDTTMTTSVMFLLRLRYNSSPALPEAGSKLHELDKITEDLPERIEVEVARTLRPLIDSNQISNLATTTTVTERPGAENFVEVKVQFQDSRGDPQTAAFGLSF